jgi:hypothetical protein
VTHSTCFDGVNKYGHFQCLGRAFFGRSPWKKIGRLQAMQIDVKGVIHSFCGPAKALAVVETGRMGLRM